MWTLVGKQSDTDILKFCIPYYIFPFIAYKLITIDSILIMGISNYIWYTYAFKVVAIMIRRFW